MESRVRSTISASVPCQTSVFSPIACFLPTSYCQPIGEGYINFYGNAIGTRGGLGSGTICQHRSWLHMVGWRLVSRFCGFPVYFARLICFLEGSLVQPTVCCFTHSRRGAADVRAEFSRSRPCGLCIAPVAGADGDLQ